MPEVEQVLRRSGWFPGRRIDSGPWQASMPMFDWHDAAEKFLCEFGGLRVDVRGPGITVAREPFEIDPELARGEEGRFSELSAMFFRRFCPVGELGGELFLAIDEEGIMYLLSGWAFRVGRMDEGLERLITGVKAEKLAAPQ
ncbi:SUKH-3 domain-containing protein [Nonomuraea angiospora]|nr:SUKH-3 domain-containing protein [Nonomuraea angiospora]MDX3107728.1 SUKH-3 domain-containing protein [Nonomuraea angiospora]